MTGKRTLSAALLAGGLSQRMGMDKAAIKFASQPLWQQQLGMLKALNPSSLWISASILRSWFPPEIEIVFDGWPPRGPLGGLAASLRHLQTSHLLLLAVDLPQMTAEHLVKLWQLAEPGMGVIPQRDHHLEPLCAIYPAQVADFVLEFLNQGFSSLQILGHELRRYSRAIFYDVEPTEESLYLNMNTPAELPLHKEAAA